MNKKSIKEALGLVRANNGAMKVRMVWSTRDYNIKDIAGGSGFYYYKDGRVIKKGKYREALTFKVFEEAMLFNAEDVLSIMVFDRNGNMIELF